MSVRAALIAVLCVLAGICCVRAARAQAAAEFELFAPLALPGADVPTAAEVLAELDPDVAPSALDALLRWDAARARGDAQAGATAALELDALSRGFPLHVRERLQAALTRGERGGGDGGIAGGPDSGPCAVACALSNCRTTCAASTQKCRTGCMLGSYAYCKCKVKPAWFAYGFLSGKFAVPATPSTASAAAVLLYNSSTGVLTYELRVNGASATAAHLHQGGFGLNGAQLVTLSGGPTVFSGTTTLSPSFVTDMLVEGLYLDVHSAAFPNGELRGQVRIDSSFGAELAPSNVVPPAASSAKGYARMRYAPNKTFEFTVEVSGTTATLAHIHAGDVGVSGPVIATLPLIAPNKFSGQTGVLTDSMLVAILTEGCYVDVHSAAFPNGELRDQLLVGGLNANAEAVSVANGGVVDIELAAKASAAGKLYLILGSTSGTAPGVPTSAGTLPLQPDAYFNFTLGSPNVPPLARSLGTLDGGGATWATLTIPAGWPATLAGLQVHHAAVVIDLATLAVEWISGFERVVLIA